MMNKFEELLSRISNEIDNTSNDIKNKFINFVDDKVPFINTNTKINKQKNTIFETISSTKSDIETHDLIEKMVTIIDEDNKKTKVKQFCQYISEDNFVLLSNTSYDNQNKIYHKYLDCYEDWPYDLQSEFKNWKVVDKKNLKKHKECARCQERKYRATHKDIYNTGYDFNYYYEDIIDNEVSNQQKEKTNLIYDEEIKVNETSHPKRQKLLKDIYFILEHGDTVDINASFEDYSIDLYYQEIDSDKEQAIGTFFEDIEKIREYYKNDDYDINIDYEVRKEEDIYALYVKIKVYN